MAEVRCPMCGKANPEDLEECRYCQARLRPFWDSASNSNPDLSAEDQASDLPDWLKSLRGPDDQAGLPFPPERQAQSALPDWLSQLREQPGLADDLQAEDTSSDLVDESEDNTSSWLQNFLSDGEPADEANLPVPRDTTLQQDEAGWISRIGSTPIQEEQPLGASDALDWLSELDQPEAGPSPAGGREWAPQPASTSIEPEEPLPDWLAHVEPETPASPASETTISPGTNLSEAPAGEEDLPAWLQTAAFSTADTVETAADSEPDWTKLRPEDSGDLQWVDDEALNWLNEDDEELPAWLFDKTATAEPAQPAGAILVGQEAQPAEVTPIEAVAPVAEEAIPEQVEPALESHEEEPSAPIAGELALTGVLSEEPLAEEQPQASEPAGTEPHEDEEAPMLAGAALAAIGLEAALDSEQDQDELGWLGELEDTYADLSLNAPDESTLALEGAGGFGQEAGSTLPIWLTKAAEAEEQAESVEEQAELKPAELPSWLQAMRPVGLVAAGASLSSENEPQQVEGAGPLAGLRGALPAEPDVTHLQKPPVYSLKLQVSDTQQFQAELLRGLIEGEGQQQALPGRPAISSQDFIRLFIAVLLIFPLLFVVLTGSPQFDLPAPSSEVEAVGKQIDALPPGAPVLLAVDYQPGFSGEMDAITSPVVQHLFERGAYLALVSTTPTGPAQAEHLLAQVRSTSGVPLQSLANSTNLGYIPGGATGLLSFAQAPRDTLPANTHGERVWETGSLQGVDGLDKFALVIVATENPDTARYWVEQVQPQLGTTPLLMLLSAQAGPMVWPYYHASPSQVQGLLSGLAGGAAYQVRSVQGGAATQFWSPYSAGVWIAALLMVAGGMLFLIMARTARKKAKVGGDKRP